MSLAPFAQLENRVNNSVIGALANAVAVVGGNAVPVIFDLPYDSPFDGQFDSGSPECTGTEAALGELERGSVITVTGVNYTVERVEPDGSGLVRLALARSA